MAAFNAAAENGAHMIELDVSLSVDRQLVVLHDDTVDRTTNGCGSVDALTFKELQGLDAGSWFDPRFHGERIPALAQVLDEVKDRLMVNVEIKPNAFEPHGPVDAVERQVLELIHANDMGDDIIVSSFEWQVLETLRLLDPHIALGLLSDRPADENLRYWINRIDGFSWHPDSRVLTPSQVASLHELGAKVLPYAVGSRIDAQQMLAMGVDGLIVDNPNWV
jgi:glycerophosphoryl diester phosphodiesterase